MAVSERVLVVGGDESSRERTAEELRSAGFEVASAPAIASDIEPADLYLVAGPFEGEGARRDAVVALADAVAAVRAVARDAVVIASAPSNAVDASIAAGADDVLLPSATASILKHRVRINLRMGKNGIAVQRHDAYSNVLNLLAESTGVTLESPDPLPEVLARIADAIDWDRAALLLRTDNGLLLIAASDDATATKIPLNPDRYPEVDAAFEERRTIEIENTKKSELMGPWAELAATHGGAALAAVPLFAPSDGEREVIGVLLLRSARVGKLSGPRVHDFLRLVANQLVLVLTHAKVFEALREQTHKKKLGGLEEERRSKALEQYKDFFESASDGMIAVDREGRVLALNRAAEQMTGYARSGLILKPLSDIVAPSHREALSTVIQQVASGANLESFDLQMSTTSGEKLTVSVASSSVLAEYDAAILAIRDVTDARRLEGELHKTKDFLERLIDSAFDAIIAADMRGKVIIFNQGAARLTGYSPDEVLGKIPVWQLYPEGIARAIMSELRADQFGGRGRLEPSRREIVNKQGELVPVSMAASIVYEGRHEVASVGILSDLRERLNIEQRLAQAQEKLVHSEKQALIAELAGTAAHELNQPLTSVMGYAELLKKKIDPNDPSARPVDIILAEAERMAEIVRKIGRITRYETKPYVGSTQILDLDKASSERDPNPSNKEHNG